MYLLNDRLKQKVALQIEQEIAEAWFLKDGVLNHLQRYEEAIQSIERALQLNPIEACWLEKGILLSRMKRSEEALQCYRKVIEINPQNDD
ncbi:MAG: tetratricopeptide repeat protein, partial [Nitrososphaeraceae archaeon]